jgi:glycosyltransferase involved in cell wall biosynthesis
MLRLADKVYWVRGESFENGRPDSFDWIPYARVLDKAIAAERPVAVLAHYIWMAPCLDSVPDGVVKVLDTLDLMHTRTAIYGSTATGAWVECSREEETELILKADVVIAIQETERREFAAMAPGRQVVCIPHAVKPRCMEDPGNSNIVAFVGSAIEGNIEGVERFIAEAWPVVRDRHPEARLKIFGEVVRRLGSVSEVNGVTKVGFVRDLDEVYGPSAVIVNPVTRGTGLKIKAVEAMAHCRAVVSTSCGAAGLEDAAGRALLVEDDFVRFGAEVARLLTDREFRESLGREAGNYAMEKFAPPGVLAPLLEHLPL